MLFNGRLEGKDLNGIQDLVYLPGQFGRSLLSRAESTLGGDDDGIPPPSDSPVSRGDLFVPAVDCPNADPVAIAAR